MWESRVEIEDYSGAYLDCIATFKVLYHWTSAEGGAHTQFVDVWISNKSMKRLWAPPLTKVQRYGASNAVMSHVNCVLVSFPGLPSFYLLFVFTIIHGSRRPAKNGEGLGAFITWMTSGGCKVGEGPNCQNNAQDHPSSALPCFLTPDLSMKETTRLDW